MKKYLRLFLMFIIALLFSFILSPIIDFLSGLIGFGMGLGLSYLIICVLENKYGWFKNK